MRYSDEIPSYAVTCKLVAAIFPLIVSDSLQCFDTVGWAAWRASGL